MTVATTSAAGIGTSAEIICTKLLVSNYSHAHSRTTHVLILLEHERLPVI